MQSHFPPYKYSFFTLALFCLPLLMLGQTNKPKLEQSVPADIIVNQVATPPAFVTAGAFNFDREFRPRVPIDDPTLVSLTAGPSQVITNTMYKDGFNRNILSIQHNFTDGKNLVAPVDTRFRPDATTFLPYSTSSMGFRADAFAEQKAYFGAKYPGEGYTSLTITQSTSTPYTRSAAIYPPGKSQVGQYRGTETTILKYNCNCIRRWKLNSDGKPISYGFYVAGQLIGTKTQLPTYDNIIPPHSIVYKNKDGRVILQQVSDSAYGSPTPTFRYQNTVYIYDAFGRISYIIPPQVSDATTIAGTISQNTLDQYCFQYKYDSKGRKTAQKMPGKGWEYFIYDNRDRLVFHQDSVLRAQNGTWEFTIYDALNRPISTGLMAWGSSNTQDKIQQFFETSATYTQDNILYYLTNYELIHKYPSLTLTNATILTYNYYDDYREADPNNTLWNTYTTQLDFNEQQNISGSETITQSIRTRGLPTGSKIRMLPSPAANGTGTWRNTATFYDDKGRVIYTATQDVNDNNSIIHASYAGTQYNFTGQVLTTKHVLINNKASDSYLRHVEVNKNEYETATSRLSKTWRKVDNASDWTLTSSLSYDDLGRLQRKVLSNGGETQDYSYNIRGHLTGINGVFAESGNRENQFRSFGESLKYDYGFEMPRYDGKIAGIIWRGSAGANLGNNISHMHAYGYDYDLSGRLKLADYYLQEEYNGHGQVNPWNKGQLDFTVSGLFYDKNGNLRSMKQRGVKPGVGPVDMDILSYSYINGNQLNAVADNGVANYMAGDFQDGHAGSDDYSYDANGNLSTDLNKSIIGIKYNHLNKPTEITFSGGKKIEYSYDAAGTKVQELVLEPGIPTKKLDYVTNFLFLNDSLRYAMTADGRTSFNYLSNTPAKEEYFVKDHLGNVRSIIDITTKPMREYLATYEVASANLEGMLFEKVGEIRETKPGSTDPGDSKAGRLNGSEAGREIGTSLLMKVMAGDMVDMNVNNFYEAFEGNSDDPVPAEQILQSVITTLTGGVGGFEGSESHNTKLVNELFTPDNFEMLENVIRSQGIDPSRPQAYLTYALFDENMRLVEEFSGAYQVNGAGDWNTIGSGGARMIPKNGYLAVYLNTRWKMSSCIPCANIFFDQLDLQIAQGSLLEENHYYPFGLPIAPLASTAVNHLENRQKYQGNEYIKSLGLNWMDFKGRQYDPQIGRFLSVDPLADHSGQEVLSPYTAMANDPTRMVDPDGLENTVYIINLPSSGFSTTELQNIIDGLNAWMQQAGLEITYILFQPVMGVQFSMNDLSESDAVVVLGTPDEVSKYAQNNLGDKMFYDGDNWGGKNHPGATHRNISGIDANGVKADAKDLKSDLGAAMIFTILHETGHPAKTSYGMMGEPHSHSGVEDNVIMSSGAKISAMLRHQSAVDENRYLVPATNDPRFQSYRDMMQLKYNKGYVEQMKNFFNSDYSKDNRLLRHFNPGMPEWFYKIF